MSLRAKSDGSPGFKQKNPRPLLGRGVIRGQLTQLVFDIWDQFRLWELSKLSPVFRMVVENICCMLVIKPGICMVNLPRANLRSN